MPWDNAFASTTAWSSVCWDRSITFRGEDLVLDGPNEIFGGGGGIARQVDIGIEQRLTGALGTIELDLNDRHGLSYRLIVNDGEEQTARIQTTSSSVPQQAPSISESLIDQERSLRSHQLTGRHKLPSFLSFEGADRPGLEVRWSIGSNRFDLDEPDTRFAAFLSGATQPALAREQVSTTEDDSDQYRLDLVVPFLGEGGDFGVGFFRDERDRDTRQTTIIPPLSIPFPGFNGGLGGGGLGPFVTRTESTATARYQAIYAMAGVPLGPRLHLNLGARYESTRVRAGDDAPGPPDLILLPGNGQTTQRGLGTASATADIDEETLLPAVDLSFDLTADMQIHGAYSQTIARPTLRELDPLAATAFLEDAEFLGNPDLDISDVENYDLSWEWRPAQRSLLGVGAFRKDIDDPIERILFSASNRDFITPINYEQARIDGIEVEARLGLEDWSPGLRGVGIGIAYTEIDSEVALPGGGTRDVVGQPEFFANVNLTYETGPTGYAFGMIYNRIGDTLIAGAEVASDPANTILVERDTLDLTFSKRWRGGLALSFNALNLTESESETAFERSDGVEFPRTRRKTPMILTASVRYDF